MTEPAPIDAPPPARHGRRPAVIVGVLVVIIAAAAIGATVWLRGGGGPTTYSFVVPAGTAAQVARGQRVSVMPALLTAHVGDRIRIANHDSATAIVGPYVVRAGETLDQEFRVPGRIVAGCSLQRNGTMQILIT